MNADPSPVRRGRVRLNATEPIGVITTTAGTAVIGAAGTVIINGVCGRSAPGTSPPWPDPCRR
jgi:hypothetical protein